MSVLRKHARSVVFKQLPPSLEVRQVISSLPSGSIHNIIPKPNDSLVINFLDPHTASRFTRNFLSLPRAPSIKDVSIEYGSSKPLPVEILAEIGLRSASRVVRVSSNNGKDIPNGLENELKELGAIESFEVNSDARSAVVHFMSIDAAMQALQLLRANKSYDGFSVYFGIDRKANPPRFSRNAQTDLVLTGLPKGITSSEIIRRIQSGLPSLNREAIRSIVFDEKSAKAFINFLEPAAAKIVFDSFNTAKTSTGGVSVSWSSTPANPVNPSLRIAVSAGVSRTLTVSHLQNVRPASTHLED
ncbi:hypothetical protein BT96DRAFT_98369 [Gymnopus androsaceus JB14]|uniref:RRM domain-containing protein n=1 Tax=Gymnopus androsaceus JB14 TaxID=1447944 RepID=A0A6A4HG28_9AGAR|nr:hypothetical protein BT96DRAFT_98369 [Gymnopus androsaceus JB14]